jgi:hypothetical protein
LLLKKNCLPVWPGIKLKWQSRFSRDSENLAALSLPDGNGTARLSWSPCA